MKKIITLFTAVMLCSTIMFGADTWTAKADFSGAIRHWGVGFSIGSKGYMGTGYGGGVYRKDIWEYDPALDIRTQMADFTPGNRFRATGFSIGSKGYICCGTLSSGTQKKDLWEFDPVANTWTAKTDFAGTARELASVFVIGTKAYMGTGYSGTTYKSDMFEYNQSTDTWTARASHPFSLGTAGGVGFAIGTKGYLGTGYYSGSPSGNVYFYCYDPALNSWSSVANISGSGFREAIAFTIGGKGYVGIGGSASTYSPSFYEYDPIADGWTPKTNFLGGGRYQAAAFAIGTKGYVGTGIDGSAEHNDFYEWKNCSAAPGTPSSMSGSTTICVSTSNNYSVPAVSGATSYTWTLPGGWTGSSATNTISALAGSTPGTVMIQVVANNACGTSSPQILTVSVNACTGVQENAENNLLSVFPNPATDNVTIELSEKVKTGTIKITNTLGQIVFEEAFISDGTTKTTKHIDITNYAKGVYSVSIESEGNKSTKKLVVK